MKPDLAFRRPAHRDVIPRPVFPVRHLLDEDDCRRLHHVDLGGLTERELWAEQRMVENELARLTFNNIRTRRLDDDQTDQDWLAARLCRLRDERAKRKTARDTHAP